MEEGGRGGGGGGRCVANGERAGSCGGERMEGDGQLW